MSEFIFVYRFPENYIGSPEAASVWESWFDALGTSLFDKGNPVFVRAATGDTGQDTWLGGYSLITAENIDAAVKLATNCPIVTSAAVSGSANSPRSKGATTRLARSKFPPRWHPVARRSRRRR